MKTSAHKPDVKSPGALSVETLGVHAVAPSETSSSTPHSNAEVLVDLDVGIETTQPPGPGSEGAPGGGRSGVCSAARAMPRLLVADDSPTVRELLARALGSEGYEVVLAGDGEEALERYASDLIDLVVLDLEMPVKSGWAVFDEIVSRNENQAIVLLADHLDAVDLATTGRLTRVAEKPVNVHALLTTIKRALSEATSSRRSTVTSQQNLLRYTKPFESSSCTSRSYDHWGLND
jgi:CheY-like chemotaxis protein